LIPPKDFGKKKTFKILESFNDVYIVTDLMEIDLKEVIRGKNPQPLDDNGIKYVV
jgi:hypothetical protein